MVIIVFVLSFIFCGFHPSHIGADGDEGHHQEGFLCAVGLDNFVPSEDQSSSLIDMRPFLASIPQVLEPNLPILSDSILKIPKPA